METVMLIVLFSILFTISYIICYAIYEAVVLSGWVIDVIIEISKWVENTDSPRKG